MNVRIFLINLQGPDCIINDEGKFIDKLIRELANFIEDEITLLCLGTADLPEQEHIKLKVNRKRTSINITRFFTKDSNGIKTPFEGTLDEQQARFRDFNEQIVRFLDYQKGLIHLIGGGIILNIVKEFKDFSTEVEYHDPRRIVVSLMSLDSVEFSVKSEEEATIFSHLKAAEEKMLKFADKIIIHDEKIITQLKELYPDMFLQEKIQYIPFPKDDWTDLVEQYRSAHRSFI